MTDFDMRAYAKSIGVSLAIEAGGVVFTQGERGISLYIVQSGLIEMVANGHVIDVCGPNDVFGFMAVIDGAPRTSTARVKEDAELSVLDERKFRYMMEEVPYFALYMMEAMARRIRGLGEGYYAASGLRYANTSSTPNPP